SEPVTRELTERRARQQTRATDERRALGVHRELNEPITERAIRSWQVIEPRTVAKITGLVERNARPSSPGARPLQCPREEERHARIPLSCRKGRNDAAHADVDVDRGSLFGAE